MNWNRNLILLLAVFMGASDIGSGSRSGRNNGELFFQNVGIGLACCGIHGFIEAAREKCRGWVDTFWD